MKTQAYICISPGDRKRLERLVSDRNTWQKHVKPSVEIGDGVWICADAFVGPGVHVGALAVVGDRAVAVRNVPAEMVVVGNPARPVGRRQVQTPSIEDSVS